MKITSSEVAFNADQSKSSTTQYSRHSSQQAASENTHLNLSQQPADMMMMDVIELSYEAKIRSEHSASLVSKSSVQQLQGIHPSAESLPFAVYEQHRTTHSLVQKTLTTTAVIENLRIAPNTVSLNAPQATQAYNSVNQNTPSNSASLSLKQLSASTQARVEIKEQYVFREEERLHIGTQGRVTTADGRQIDFMLQLDMQRSFSIEETLHMEDSQRQLIDPIVINLDGGAASLTSNSFSFDLNADGIKEQISFVGQGSGFLAIDRNQDGKINDGSELFGTGQKNGFSELAQYDDDDNKWLDENDAIYQKLKIWTRDTNGKDQLISLKEAGVGAIYLGSSAASFDFTDSENKLLGQIKRSGIYLTEKGKLPAFKN